MKAFAKFLGRIYEVDGRCDRDVAAQMAHARSRFNELYPICKDNNLGDEMKLALSIVMCCAIRTNLVSTVRLDYMCRAR